jgi:hypothetical protein
MVPPYAERFWIKVVKGPRHECWRWTGAYSEKRHYPPRPVFWLCYLYDDTGKPCGQVIVPAARVALHLTDGRPLGERIDLYACHKPDCANPACVNPEHLYWGTEMENRWDRYGSVRDPQYVLDRYLKRN